jgi:hypothetical protein
MAMPPNSTGSNSAWWTNFHLSPRLKDEGAFLGYLDTNGMTPFALSGAELETAYANFQGWLAASREAPTVQAAPQAAPSPEAPQARPAPFPHGRRR